MNLLVRTDFSAEIGSGHLARCLTICALLKPHAESIVIATKTPPGELHKKIFSQGFNVIQIPTALDEVNDALFCQTWLAQQKAPHWSVILDHYKLGSGWEDVFFRHKKLLVIDDLGRFHHCDLLLDSNFRDSPSSFYEGKVPSTCICLLGPEYFPLRREFIETKSKTPARNPRQVMVCFGGTDPTGETLKFLRKVKPAAFDFIVAVPSSNRQIDEIRSLKFGDSIQIRIDPKMAELMASSSLYLGSGGTITWERLYMGLPGLIVTVADNQIENANTLNKKQIHRYYGHWNRIDYESVESELQKFTRQEIDFSRQYGERLVKPLELKDIQQLLL